MIEFKKVSKRYSNGHDALTNINLAITEGEFVFITGHSGAGKTTLLKLIMLMEQCSGGQITINGNILSRLSTRKIPFYRRQIGMIFQNPMLLPERTIFENVALPMVITGLPRHDVAKRVRAALAKVGLLNKAPLFPIDLSIGEQQRIGIARAVANKPSLIMADEPTGNLDPKLSLEIMQLFEEFNAVGVNIMIASHDISLISRMHHRIITLNKGKMVD